VGAAAAAAELFNIGLVPSLLNFHHLLNDFSSISASFCQCSRVFGGTTMTSYNLEDPHTQTHACTIAARNLIKL